MGAAGGARTAARPTPLKPPPTPEPLVPTPLPPFRATAFPRASETPTVVHRPAAVATPRADQPATGAELPAVRATALLRASVTPTAVDRPVAVSTPRGNQPWAGSDRARVGAALALGKFADYDWGESAPGWYLSWRVDPQPVKGVRFAQMVRVSASGFYPPLETIRRTAQANPGSLWLIGNEPDVKWQDNVTPERYADCL